MSRLRYLLALSRPRFWLYLAGPVVVGVAWGAASAGELFSPTTVALFAYFLLPANVLLYGVNDRFDAEIDAENPKKDEDGKEVRYRSDPWVRRAIVASAVAPLALLTIVPAVAYPWIAGFLALAVAYSAPPLRFKTTPGLDSLSNGLYVLPGAAAYAAVAGAHPPAVAVLGGWAWAMGMHTFSAIPDIEPDRSAGIETTATRLGERATYGYCAVCWLLAAALFGLLDPRLAVPLLVYPTLALAVPLANVAVDRAYWWFPAINVAVGAMLTMSGLWVMLHA